MFRNMVTSLLEHGKIRTTDVKAKEIRRWADHIVTLAKRGDLHARRQALAIVRKKELVHKLFEEAQARFGAVEGGYTRITKIGPRKGDAAPLSLVELLMSETGEKGEKRRGFFGFGAKKDSAKEKPEKKAAAEKKAAGQAPEPAPAQPEAKVEEEEKPKE
jgi:large subunit ribosomal protein L17